MCTIVQVVRLYDKVFEPDSKSVDICQFYFIISCFLSFHSCSSHAIINFCVCVLCCSQEICICILRCYCNKSIIICKSNYDEWQLFSLLLRRWEKNQQSYDEYISNKTRDKQTHPLKYNTIYYNAQWFLILILFCFC